MQRKARTSYIRWEILALMLFSALACSLFEPTPEPGKQYIPLVQNLSAGQTMAPQALEVTRIVEGPPVVVTVEVPVTVEVTRLVEAAPVQLVQTVEVTRVVPATQIVYVIAPTNTSVRTPTALVTVTPVGYQTYFALPLHYDFEGNFISSGVVDDRSGNGHDAQVIGVVGTASGLSGGQAISFDGRGYIQAEGNPLGGRSAATISLWFQTDHPEYNYKLASAAWWEGGPGSGWIMATQMPEFWSDNMQSLYLPGLTNNNNRFTSGEWTHEALTYDGSRIREYTNGRLVNDWPTTGAKIGYGQPMVIGAWPQYPAYNFHGNIDEFQLYDRALSQGEIQAIYNAK